MSEDQSNIWPVAIVGVLAAIPLIGGLISLVLSSLSEQGGSGGGSSVTRGKMGARLTESLKEIESVDSLYFDVSVARHSLDEKSPENALRWLDENHALREARRSVESGLLTRERGEEVVGEIERITGLLKEEKIEEGLNAIIPLQNRVAEETYAAFAKTYQVTVGNPEPKIDAKFESQREEKRKEWADKGYPEGLIEKGLTWAEEYSIGMAAKITEDPGLRFRIEQELYPKSLDMANNWIEGLWKALT